MNTRALIPVLLCCAAWGCGSTATPASDAWQSYGEGVSPGQPVSVAQVLQDPQAHDGQALLLQGTVSEVCQVKGCWMTLNQGDQSMRVTFKDYAFFVPMDITGRTVRMQGTFSIREVPVDEARHYLEDAGRHDEAAALTQPQRGYQLVASGVAVQDEG